MQGFQPFPAAASSTAPAEPEQELRFVDALKFVFTMQNPWSSILQLSVLLLIPVVGQIVMFGWHCEIMQRLERRHPQPIPRFSFSDFTHYLSRGVGPFVTQMLLTMPFSMVFGIAGGIVGMAVAITTQHGHRSSAEPPFALFAGYGVVMLLAILSGPFVAIVMNAGLVRAELTEELGKALSLSGIMSYIRKTWLTTLGSSVVYGMLASLLILFGLALCYFGVFPAAIIVGVGMVHLRHQIYRKYLARGGEPIPMKPAVAVPSEQAAV